MKLFRNVFAAALCFLPISSFAAKDISRLCNNCSTSRMQSTARNAADPAEPKVVYVVDVNGRKAKAYAVSVTTEENPYTGTPTFRIASMEVTPNQQKVNELFAAVDAAASMSGDLEDIDLGNIPYGCGYGMPSSGYALARPNASTLATVVENGVGCYLDANLDAFMYVWANEFTAGLLRTWVVDFTFRTNTWLQITFPDGNTTVYG